ncbi:hypothetical protein MH215_17200 [Paenibacillus sp. ACRSA]|uniref:hypothetical protein n=1 Tax=Paenibacillus sp. ACRSA TaxID=2918211 RepID=UPI001EF57139|nr:hypothetical protein [Paenibacillus sp. ACRSA]MCG7378748.1 hypothetical protein [Paenibacillus sp. ACRSA]
MKMPVMLHVVRGLLGLKLVLLVYWMVLLQIKIKEADARFMYLDVNSENLYSTFGYLEGEIYVRLIPALLAVTFISCKLYKTTIILLIVTLLQAIASKEVLSILIHLFMLIVVLVHRPSKTYLQRLTSKTEAANQ